MRVVVVEDQILFRELLVSLLARRPGVEVVAFAEDGPGALDRVRATLPDLVVLDILIPRLSGIEVARIILAELPATRILALSTELDPHTVHQLHQLNLAGFIDKNGATTSEVAAALDAIGAGRRYFSAGVLAALRQLRAHPQSFPKILSRREQEVLSLIGGGLSDAQIGQLTGLTENSVQSHRRNILRKLDLHSTPELMRYALEAGFWKPAYPRLQLESRHPAARR